MLNVIANVVGSVDLVSAHFEYGVSVYGGGISMTDVMAFTEDAVIAVEAKAREPFDSLVLDWIDEEQARNPRSPPHRCQVVADYAQAFGVRFSALLPLRYQLLHRTLSAALTARERSNRAWMIVQSFAPLNSSNINKIARISTVSSGLSERQHSSGLSERAGPGCLHRLPRMLSGLLPGWSFAISRAGRDGGRA